MGCFASDFLPGALVLDPKFLLQQEKPSLSRSLTQTLLGEGSSLLEGSREVPCDLWDRGSHQGGQCGGAGCAGCPAAALGRHNGGCGGSPLCELVWNL